MESDILLAAADDSSSYVASQPPSVAGLESLDNSMDGFPDASGRDEDSLMDADDLTADADAFQKNPSSSPPAEPGKPTWILSQRFLPKMANSRPGLIARSHVRLRKTYCFLIR